MYQFCKDYSKKQTLPAVKISAVRITPNRILANALKALANNLFISKIL